MRRARRVAIGVPAGFLARPAGFLRHPAGFLAEVEPSRRASRKMRRAARFASASALSCGQPRSSEASMHCKLLTAVVAGLLPFAAQAATIDYKTAGDCDGFPAVSLATPPGVCVGLVATHLGFARGVAAIDRDVYVVDMGGWGSHKGRLLRLADGGRGAPEVLMQGLFQPNAILPGPHRTLYLGVTGQVLQVDPAARDVAASARVVVANLPTTGRHPMPALALGADGALFVNVGSETDNCHGEDNAAPDPKAACPETQQKPPRGSVLRFAPRDTPWDASQQAPYALGLRNSMAMAVLADGRLVVAANARDGIHRVAPALADAEFPHEPMAVLEPGADYGWPYCYDALVPSPEYPGFDCGKKHAPDLLLPAHAAPLGMILYRGDRLPGLHGKLVVGFHGYKPTGRRIVAIGLDGKSRPAGPPVDLVSGWDAVPDAHPQGAPLGLFELGDGSVLVTEDHNGSLLRVSAAKAR